MPEIAQQAPAWPARDTDPDEAAHNRALLAGDENTVAAQAGLCEPAKIPWAGVRNS